MGHSLGKQSGAVLRSSREGPRERQTEGAVGHGQAWGSARPAQDPGHNV